MTKNLREELEELSSEKYRSFSEKLLPGIDNIIGVKLGDLRKISKRIAKKDPESFLRNAKDDTFEEIMIQGMVIGYWDLEIYKKLSFVKKFIPKINNWSVCDSFCNGLKFANKYPDEVWNFIIPYIRDKKTYYVRFGAVMMLKYFVDERHIKLAFKEFDNVKNNEYYAQMAVAWAISCYFLKFKSETIEYIKHNNLDKFTLNKALQKIIESRCLDDPTKNEIRIIKSKI